MCDRSLFSSCLTFPYSLCYGVQYILYPPFAHVQSISALPLTLFPKCSLSAVPLTYSFLILLIHKYIKEVEGKSMQYKLIHSFYFTPSKLHRMSVTSNDLCWTCKLDMQTLAHATWKYKQVHPFQKFRYG